MANFTRRERTTKHVEYLHRKGDCVGELYKALNTAWAERCRLRGEAPGSTRESDDWAWVDFDDEHVIIRFEIEKVTE